MGWLSTITFVIATMLRSHAEGKRMIKHSIEETMVSLVECTQTGQLMPLDWHVKLPDEMRQRLYYPLTHDIVHTICTTREKPQVNRFSFCSLGYEEGKGVITGCVGVTIDYVNAANGLDLHYHNVVLHIEWTFENGKGWYVSSVEHN